MTSEKMIYFVREVLGVFKLGLLKQSSEETDI